MAGFVPAIHAVPPSFTVGRINSIVAATFQEIRSLCGVDAGDKPGHDKFDAHMSHSLCDLVLRHTRLRVPVGRVTPDKGRQPTAVMSFASRSLKRLQLALSSKRSRSVAQNDDEVSAIEP